MKKILTVIFVLSLISACGGGSGGAPAAGGDAASGGATTNTSAETPLTSDKAVTTSQAISSAAVGISQAIGGSAPSSKSLSQKSLGILKDTGSFTGVAAGSGGGNCTLTGSGASELSTNPMTFSVSGTMVCDSFATTITTASGDVQVTLSGSISTSMSGTIKQDYSVVEISYTMNWSNLVAKIGTETFNSITGNYSLSIVGKNGVLTLTESGTVGSQSVSQTRSFTVDYTPEFETVSIYDNFVDDSYMYVDTTKYLGTYVSPNAASNTCPVNSTAYITAMTHTDINFDVNGFASSASGDLSKYYDFYMYYGYGKNDYCTFGVSSANLTSKTIDILTMVCYDYDDVKVCDAGWTKDSAYDATYSLIKSLSTSSGEEAALKDAFKNLEAGNKAK